MGSENREGARLARVIATRRTPMSPLPEHVREQAVAYARRRAAQGASQATVARELAVTQMTVSRWLSTAATKKGLRRRPKPAELRPVRVVEAPAPVRGAVSLTTTGGLRVDGLSVDELVAVLRALG